MTDSTPPAPLAADTPNFHKFDSEKLCTWVYPTNYPIRTYQLNMVEKALFQNTLIALPTGLGKTFIGAVVMLNYWRWFPESKVVFLAPTRPLVSQQLEACFNICGIPQSETIEMTGQMAVSKRRQHWSTKRVFFMTPETMQNDLVSRICPAERIACLVIDEAHRATGNYAFVEVVRSIANSHPHFRVLALTATPGSNLDNVQTVVNNLHLNTIQIKTEQDLEQFLHNKIIERKVIDERPELWFNTVETFQTSIFQPLLVELASSNVISTNDPKGNKPYYLMKARHFFQDNALDVSARKRIHLINTFEICEALSRANELLETHGIGAFVESLDHATNVAIRNNRELQQLIQSLKDKMTDPGFESHPKMEQLIKVLLKHFGDADDVSKVLIFSNYRSSVSDICKKINTFPWVRAAEFVGTTNGLTKAQQQQIITRFKNDELNTLVCTSIGEEGLDIGQVDLIVCYDSQSSPVRMLQRMGRTGRSREGRCVLLLTEAEGKKYSQAKDKYLQIQHLIARGDSIRYHHLVPSVLPENYRPAMLQQKITIPAVHEYTTDGKMKESTMDAFINSFPGHLHSLDALVGYYWPHKTKLNTMISIQRNLQCTHRVPHSKTTKYFTTCMRRMESRIHHRQPILKRGPVVMAGGPTKKRRD